MNVQEWFAVAAKHRDWWHLEDRSWKERITHYPVKTVWWALIDRIYFFWIAVTRNPIITTRTFWGAPIRVRFAENRAIVHNGLIGSKEIALTEYLVHTLTEKDIFFDVGANAGFYTMLGLALGAKTVAFEAMPRTFAVLKKNAPNATLVEKAVMDNDQPQLFADYGEGAGLSKALRGETAEHTVTVQSVTLDQYCRETGLVPTVIKIDAENAESFILDGAKELLTQHHPTLIIEANEAIAEKTKGFGYNAFQLQENGEPIPYKTGDIIMNDNLLFKLIN